MSDESHYSQQFVYLIAADRIFHEAIAFPDRDFQRLQSRKRERERNFFRSFCRAVCLLSSTRQRRKEKKKKKRNRKKERKRQSRRDNCIFAPRNSVPREISHFSSLNSRASTRLIFSNYAKRNYFPRYRGNKLDPPARVFVTREPGAQTNNILTRIRTIDPALSCRFCNLFTTTREPRDPRV